jgi:hypothetical protein
VAEVTTRHMDLGDNILAFRILGAHNVDGCEQRCDRRKKTRLGNVTSRTDATAEAKASCTRVTDRRVKLAVRSEVTGRVEGLGIGVILWVM